ncbi:aspartate aminotransferase family protein [Limosilactobacillus fastidiosus]|uniref:Aspartate aminotransferase family protein n=2 Tax=Limosilactobacillus fastidiosus TaxID=2759855 RepID=A0A7W3TZI4_9LACO|nr:aspartate aminotransferase family protein [Limosilactobacillus fastidiosus]MBB1086186.1 aspartate aminotransferase family protein [Limosilactobacillus fastidiosus]MCD7086484.1 aspartate aminotransferase family protein [Limosilactobacillus fastidiosus]MCD7114646.1 aspartate aminotransferase family protein [Limosilactobacillus fastidiosus]MCD7116507.1 aspartate aminotransferase family protein [Limosilactobacillus fastidiosus]
MGSMKNNHQILAKENKSFATAARVKYYDIVIDSGRGAILTDADGNQYIDLLASASSTNTGHCHPKVVKAIQEQLQKIIQYTPAYFANSQAACLAPRLAKLAPMSGPVEVVWGNSGSDANDAIIKFARAYTGRQYIVSFTGAYHGSTYGSMTLSSVSLNMARKMGPLLPGVVKVPFPDPWDKLPNETEEQFVKRYFKMFKLPFETYLPVDEVAAILIEPIQGDGGIVKTPPEFMKKIYQFAKEHGILFAIDEVNQGMGRTGKWWSIQHFGIEPDLMSIGKSLASGMPLSAVVGRKEIMESLGAPANVYTTAGNPVTTAAANATLDVIQEEHLLERSTKLGKKARQFFEGEQAKYDFIGDVRMYGLDGGIDIVDPQTGKGDTEATTRIMYRVFELGAIIISLRGNIFRFQPPLVITEEELDQAFAILDQAFAEEAAGKLSLPENAEELGW